MLTEDFLKCELSRDLLKTTDEKNLRDCAHLKIKIHDAAQEHELVPEQAGLIIINYTSEDPDRVQIFTLRFWIRKTFFCTWSTILLKTGVTPRTEICGKPIPRIPSNLQTKCRWGSMQNLETYVSSAAVK